MIDSERPPVVPTGAEVGCTMLEGIPPVVPTVSAVEELGLD